MKVGPGYLLKIGESHYCHLPCEYFKREECLGFTAFELGSIHLKLAAEFHPVPHYAGLYFRLQLRASACILQTCALFLIYAPKNYNVQKVGGILRWWSYSKGVMMTHDQNISVNYKADIFFFFSLNSDA